MASKKKKKSSTAPVSAGSTDATVTMMSFANPPAAATSPATVADGCAKAGFAAIGILVSSDAQIIDFSLIDDGMCQTLASSIEVCVDGKGFSIPALTGTFMIMQRKGTQITVGNFVTALTQLMSSKP
jgi:hypothetical protein